MIVANFPYLLVLVHIYPIICQSTESIEMGESHFKNFGGYGFLQNLTGLISFVDLRKLLELQTTSHTGFRLHTGVDSKIQILHTGNLDELLKSNINRNTNTWFIIHGWTENGDDSRFLDVKDAILKAYEAANVIIIDWSKISVTSYPVARMGIIFVASELARFINFLKDNGFSLDRIHLVGISLGAHIAGLAGKQITGGLVGSITGLDPASFLFYNKHPYGRLNQYDAQYVEIIHTNAGFLGFPHPIGTTDIYVNGGLIQPGCGDNAMCSHLRSREIYLNSFSNRLVAFKCDTLDSARQEKCPTNGVTLNVGGILPKTWTPGIYTLSTR